MSQPFDFLGQAIKFRSIMGQPVAKFDTKVLDLQVNLIEEEYREFEQAYEDCVTYPADRRLAEDALKELADLVYVCFQFAAAAGWELDEALVRVHESNLSKLVQGQPIKDESGKVLKGPNYRPPFLEDLV